MSESRIKTKVLFMKLFIFNVVQIDFSRIGVQIVDCAVSSIVEKSLLHALSLHFSVSADTCLGKVVDIELFLLDRLL